MHLLWAGLSAPIVPTPADELPDPPTTSDPVNFDARSDASLLAQQGMVPQFNAGLQNVYMPAAISTAPTGTKIASGALPADWLTTSTAGAGKKQLNGSWTTTGLAAAGAGTDVRYYRIAVNADNRDCIQGLVSQPYAFSTLYNTVGKQVDQGGNVYQVINPGTSAASGGPTGTGNSIVDGTVTWKYIGPKDLRTDNTNVSTGQPFNPSQWDIIIGNA
ncbi:hypothetical protein [Undibacterium terreum]|uniref:Uncharacterized protein n=1 Tax=Undibacterium terreum TaxID=1224302 RepID=A0A916XQW4_9BURK|nr:hypothetical protein [Undibacterium terreum]GGD00118.1 hypothetical protein GCM10011396_54530 [Undibacterium terreum]